MFAGYEQNAGIYAHLQVQRFIPLDLFTKVKYIQMLTLFVGGGVNSFCSKALESHSIENSFAM